jgi:hypothetical protein
LVADFIKKILKENAAVACSASLRDTGAKNNGGGMREGGESFRSFSIFFRKNPKILEKRLTKKRTKFLFSPPARNAARKNGDDGKRETKTAFFSSAIFSEILQRNPRKKY